SQATVVGISELLVSVSSAHLAGGMSAAVVVSAERRDSAASSSSGSRTMALGVGGSYGEGVAGDLSDEETVWRVSADDLQSLASVSPLVLFEAREAPLSGSAPGFSSVCSAGSPVGVCSLFESEIW